MSYNNLTKTFRYVNSEGGSITFLYDQGFVINKPDGIDTLSISHAQAQGINQVGSTFQSSNVQSRPVTVNGVLVGSFQTENKTKLLSIVRPDLSAKLYADDYYLEVRPTSTPAIEPKEQFARFQFSVLAAYPYWQKDGSASATLSGVHKMFKLWDNAKAAETGGNGRWWNISGGRPSRHYEGDIVSFYTGQETPISKLSVAIEPQQDLHGQDAPYPAGEGRNKWLPITDQTVNNVAISWQSDGGVKLNGLCNASANATVSATLTSGTYTLSCGFSGTLPSEGTARIQLYSSGASAAIANNASQTSYQTITVAEDASFQFRIRLAGGFNYQNVILYPQLESGSSATSFAPYSNICPISGWDAVKVWDEATYDPTAQPKATIQLGSTVYGGTLDINEDGSGELTVDREIISDMGNMNYLYRNGCFDATISGGKLAIYSSGNAKAICSSYIQKSKAFTQLVDGEMALGGGYVNGSTCSAIFKNTAYTSAADFKAAMSGVQLVYELATPTTISLTAQQINTLVGENNVWADSGGISLSLIVGEQKKYRFGEVVSAQFINIQNNGQVPIPYTVTFTAIDDVNSPKLIEAATNEYLLLNKSMVAGEKVVVEITHERTYVTSSVDGECRGALDLSSSFFRLKVGDNVIKPEAAAGKENLNVQIDYAVEIVGVAV